MVSSKSLVKLAVEAAEAKKAQDITVLEVRKASKIVDHLVICTGESTPHLRAIVEEIEEQLGKKRIKRSKWEGVVKSGWIILDLGDVVVHVMGQEEREYYKLEDLWQKNAIVYHY